MTRPSPRKVGKALPPIYPTLWIASHKGVLKPFLYSTMPRTPKDVRQIGYKCDEVVKYVPFLPRKAGARRAR